MANKDSGVVNIHGKQYKTVALRVNEFRAEFPASGLITEIVQSGDPVVMKASIIDVDGRTIATGHAEENRSSSQINKTSALENCETSAIGRALAAFGLAGTEFASADEVANAIHQQKNPKRAADAPHYSKDVNNSLDPDMVATTVINFFDGDKATARDFIVDAGFPIPSECDAGELRGILDALKKFKKEGA